MSMYIRHRSADSGNRDPFGRDRPYGPFLIDGPDSEAVLTGDKSTPETLTTACHAASWLARS